MTTHTTASADFLDLVGAPRSVLRSTMARGRAPSSERLEGREFRGANTGVVPRAMGIRRFVKGFRPSGDDGVLLGYNVRVEGGNLDAPWTTSLYHSQREYAFFRARPVEPGEADSRYRDALLLDYGAAGEAAGPGRSLRDYLVEVDAGSPLLLGHAFLAVGSARVPVSWFVLEPLGDA